MQLTTTTSIGSMEFEIGVAHLSPVDSLSKIGCFVGFYFGGRGECKDAVIASTTFAA